MVDGGLVERVEDWFGRSLFVGGDEFGECRAVVRGAGDVVGALTGRDRARVLRPAAATVAEVLVSMLASRRRSCSAGSVLRWRSSRRRVMAVSSLWRSSTQMSMKACRAVQGSAGWQRGPCCRSGPKVGGWRWTWLVCRPRVMATLRASAPMVSAARVWVSSTSRFGRRGSLTRARPRGARSQDGSPATLSCRPTPSTPGRAGSRASGRSATPWSPLRPSTTVDRRPLHTARDAPTMTSSTRTTHMTFTPQDPTPQILRTDRTQRSPTVLTGHQRTRTGVPTRQKVIKPQPSRSEDTASDRQSTRPTGSCSAAQGA